MDWHHRPLLAQTSAATGPERAAPAAARARMMVQRAGAKFYAWRPPLSIHASAGFAALLRWLIGQCTISRPTAYTVEDSMTLSAKLRYRRAPVRQTPNA